LLQMFFPDVDATQAQAQCVFSIDLQPNAKSIVPALPDRVTLDSIDLSNPLELYLGLGLDVKPIVISRQDFKACIVCGGQRWGKSATLRGLAYQASLKGWTLYLAAPEDTNTFFAPAWVKIPGVQRVASEAADINAMLSAVRLECERRAKLFQQLAERSGGLPPEDIEDYNHYRRQFDLPQLLPIMLIVDEFNSYTQDIIDAVREVTRRQIRYGVCTIIAGHNFNAEDVPTNLSGLFETRIVHHVNNPETARVLLKAAPRGAVAYAQHIDVPGRAVIFAAGQTYTAQLPFVSKDDILSARSEKSTASIGAENPIALTIEETEIVNVALTELDGNFAFSQLWPIAQARRLTSADSLKKIILPDLRAQGLIERENGDVTKGYHASAKLIEWWSSHSRESGNPE